MWKSQLLSHMKMGNQKSLHRKFRICRAWEWRTFHLCFSSYLQLDRGQQQPPDVNEVTRGDERAEIKNYFGAHWDCSRPKTKQGWYIELEPVCYFSKLSLRRVWQSELFVPCNALSSQTYFRTSVKNIRLTHQINSPSPRNLIKS